MKRESLKLQESDWQALQTLAGETGSLYGGEPSWRRLVKRIARGELRLMDGRQKLVQAVRGSNGACAVGLVPRGAPCPCGSGQKFKHCCGKEL